MSDVDDTGRLLDGHFEARATNGGQPGMMMLTHYEFTHEGLKSLRLTFESNGPLTEDQVRRLYALLGKGFTVDGLERAVTEASDG